MIRITTAKKYEEDKEYGIKGFEAKITLVKSRSTAAGLSRNMVFNQLEGFDNDISNLEFVKSNGLLKGNGMAYYIEGLDSVKFRLSNFKDKIKEHPELKEHLDNVAQSLFLSAVKVSSKMSAVEAQPEESQNVILNEDSDLTSDEE